MKNLLIYSSKYCLIGKIKGLAVEAKRVRNRLLKSKSDLAISRQMYNKLAVGDDVRHHLLAYAFLRGTPYSVLEKKCRKDNKPNVKKILDIVLFYLNETSFQKLYEEKIKKWLTGELS